MGRLVGEVPPSEASLHAALSHFWAVLTQRIQVNTKDKIK